MDTWQIILNLRRRVRAQQAQLADLASQLVVARAAWEWKRAGKGSLQRLEHAVAEMRGSIHDLSAGQRKMRAAIMATLQDLRDVLAEQNQAILDEMVAINAKMDELKLNPTHLDEIVASVRANTDTVKGIIAEPLPEPIPVPTP